MSCALGAFIGSLVALQLNQYLWWVGLFIGGLTGYLSYEFKTVCRTAILARREMKKEKYAKNFFQEFNMAMSVVFWFSPPIVFLSIFYSIIFFHNFGSPEVFLWKGLRSLCEAYLFTSILFFFCSFFSAFSDVRPFFQNSKEKTDFYSVEKVFLFYFSLPKRIFLGVKFLLIRALPAFFTFVFTFLRRFFFLVHSQERLLCAFDAALGAGIGYLCGNPVIGALCGGILGVLNFEIVSRRILKLVPRS